MFIICISQYSVRFIKERILSYSLLIPPACKTAFAYDKVHNKDLPD